MSNKAVSLLAAALMIVNAQIARAEKKYDSGASDTTIRIGNTDPYSGPNSAYAIIGHIQAAYFKMINERGGINGRKIEFLSYDDAYSPPKTVEQVRKLIEADEVLLLFSQMGTPTNLAIIKYVNAKRVPQLFIAAGGTLFGDHVQYPWSMGLQPHTQGEAHLYGRYIAENYPNAKIGVLFPNDGFGRDNIVGFKHGLGKASSNIVAELTYESTEPTIDSRLVEMRAAGVEVFANLTPAKFAAMAIRKAAEMGWKPVHILQSASASVGSVLKPAGLDNSKDILTAHYTKDPDDPNWADDPGMKEFLAFLATYMPQENKSNALLAYGFMSAQALVHVLERCGDELTRANVLRQAESLDHLELGLLLPGITLTTSPINHYPIRQMQMHRFDGSSWLRFGPILNMD
ncbi:MULTISPECIES: ABC transporter substrate-binding protein [unclassified Bradyrhizobium]|uniref:ABC transporter substrate-binding protein n=1 Tax=unclassified Bradyrhizobium TaxID=2631580 RepID=UPI00339A308B